MHLSLSPPAFLLAHVMASVTPYRVALCFLLRFVATCEEGLEAHMYWGARTALCYFLLCELHARDSVAEPRLEELLRRLVAVLPQPLATDCCKARSCASILPGCSRASHAARTSACCATSANWTPWTTSTSSSSP